MTRLLFTFHLVDSGSLVSAAALCIPLQAILVVEHWDYRCTPPHPAVSKHKPEVALGAVRLRACVGSAFNHVLSPKNSWVLKKVTAKWRCENTLSLYDEGGTWMIHFLLWNNGFWSISWEFARNGISASFSSEWDTKGSPAFLTSGGPLGKWKWENYYNRRLSTAREVTIGDKNYSK